MLLIPIPWMRIAAIALVALTIAAVSFEGGRRWVLSDWSADKATRAEALAQKTTQAMEDSRRMAVAQRAKDNAYESQIRGINGRLVDALERVRIERAQRLPESSRAACANVSGRELSGPDAAFLERFAARADELRAALARCQGTPVPAE